MGKIIIFFKKNFFLKIYLLLIYRNFNSHSYEYNFSNIFFYDSSYLKKIFFSDKFFKKKYFDIQSYNYHSFDWLNIAKNIGGSENVLRSQKHIFNWSNKKYNKNSFIWNSTFLCKRFINLIYNYDFYAISASKHDKKKLHLIILEHFIIINFEIKNKKLTELKIEECKALILGSLIYEKKIIQNIDILINLLKTQLDTNGFHKSYNPLQQAEFLNHMIELKNIMLFFQISVPSELSFQIINVCSLLMNLIHKDGSIALFNGSNNIYRKEIDQLINQVSDIKPKKLSKIKNGISIYTDKNKKVFMDIVLPTSQSINDNLHASSLGFEFSALNEKIITNCGSVEKRIGKKPEYLRYSAAHSTIILNNTNISELIENKSYKRVPKKISFEIEEDENNIIWNSSHDGYLNNLHKIVKRRIIISKESNNIVGEDTIISTKINSKKSIYSIRFHLMPNCNCLLTNDKKSVLIKTKLNQTWLFQTKSSIVIENSIYVGSGKGVEQNKQIVINGRINSPKIIESWSLIKS